MSLARLVYYSAFIAGWAAFFGWALAEWLFFSGSDEPTTLQVTLVAGIIGAAIGLGLNVVAGIANARWEELLLRALPGLVGGFLGGAIGGAVGDFLYSYLGLPQAIGWMIVGLAIGVVEGAYEKSRSKIRNGLIGGGIGGLLGGFLFGLIASNSGMSGRATGFVILALCIGALIGLAQVVFTDAWLTVLDGYRAGRQLILSQPLTALGRADHLALPFLGPMNKDVEAEHVKISRRADGSYVVEDNHTRLGTRLNNQPLQAAAVLKNGDVIKFGTNFVRFNERQRRSADDAPVVRTTPSGVVAAPPPPVVRKKPGTAAPPPVPQPPPSEKPRISPNAMPAQPSIPGKIVPPPPPRRTKGTS